MRSLLPHHVRVMALTATATRKTREVVICRLSMQNPMVLSITANKPNLIYRVVPKCSMEEVVHAVGDEILQKHTQASNTADIAKKLLNSTRSSGLTWAFILPHHLVF